MDRASWEREREAMVENWTGERQRERETLRPEPPIYLFTGKPSDGLAKKQSQ